MLQPVELQFQCQLETRSGRESHIRPKGLGALMSWGPEKMLIRCSKESHHPAEWALGLWLSSPGERERHNVDSYKFGGQNITVYVRSSAPSHTQTLSNPFRTLAIKWEVYICKEVFMRLCHASIYCYDYEHTTFDQGCRVCYTDYTTAEG